MVRLRASTRMPPIFTRRIHTVQHAEQPGLNQVSTRGQRAQREPDSGYRPGTPSTGTQLDQQRAGRVNWASSERVEGGSLSGASCGAGHGTRPPESSAGKAAGWSGNRRTIELWDCERWGGRQGDGGCCWFVFSVSLEEKAG
ncbi:hypothetical protein H110_02967, partial [Trichophyton rubrum MR1448]